MMRRFSSGTAKMFLSFSSIVLYAFAFPDSPGFEARRDLAAGARLVALVSLAGGAAEPGPRALAAPLLGPRRARCRMNRSQSHVLALRLFHLEEVADLEDHAPNLGRIDVDDL